jgi:hypothetical protein
MANPKKLRFRARGTALVPNRSAWVSANTRAYVGRKAVDAAGQPGGQPGQLAWIPSGEAEEVDFHPKYKQACQSGDLWPADQETADACRVTFDPTFGGEAKASERKTQEDWK